MVTRLAGTASRMNASTIATSVESSYRSVMPARPVTPRTLPGPRPGDRDVPRQGQPGAADVHDGDRLLAGRDQVEHVADPPDVLEREVRRIGQVDLGLQRPVHAEQESTVRLRLDRRGPRAYLSFHPVILPDRAGGAGGWLVVGITRGAVAWGPATC
jgi:hypothetical protein